MKMELFWLVLRTALACEIRCPLKDWNQLIPRTKRNNQPRMETVGKNVTLYENWTPELRWPPNRAWSNPPTLVTIHQWETHVLNSWEQEIPLSQLFWLCSFVIYGLVSKSKGEGFVMTVMMMWERLCFILNLTKSSDYARQNKSWFRVDFAWSRISMQVTADSLASWSRILIWWKVRQNFSNTAVFCRDSILVIDWQK